MNFFGGEIFYSYFDLPVPIRDFARNFISLIFRLHPNILHFSPLPLIKDRINR